MQSNTNYSHEGLYLDTAATTPMEPEVSEVVRFYMEREFGNAGSRTHEYGVAAQQAVVKARQQVASVLPGVDASDVVFTSGATESNNLAILGLLKWARVNGKRHLITSSLEHKAVLGPIAFAKTQGFEVTYIPVDVKGAVCASDVLNAIRKDTFLVSIMHVNNETGILQPLDEIAEGLPQRDCYFHVDAAQGYGKVFVMLDHERIDLISISGHKIYGPKGVGALVLRRRKFKRAPLSPIQFGGGQERGLRPGTMPVPLVAGLGKAAELCKRDHAQRTERNLALRKELFLALKGIDYQLNGSDSLCVPHVANLSFPGINSEALMLALKGIIAISNGSACTSQSYEPSHVLKAMGLADDRISSAVRLSWSHMTEGVPWSDVSKALRSLI